MKFLQVYTFYPVYLDHWFSGHPIQAGNDSRSILSGLREDRFLASHDWARELVHRGWETRWWVANCRPAVDAWRRERSMGPAMHPADEDEAFARLVEEERPDVLWIGNPVRFDGRFLSKLRFRPRLVVGWMAAPFPPDIDWRGFDLLLSHLTFCRTSALRQGVRRVERFHPGFPVEIWDRLGSARPECDVVFSGQWTEAHAHRNDLFREVARACAQAPGRIDARFHFAPHASVLPPEVERLDRKARWGLDMFRALRSGRISLNAEIDVAAGEAGNMRLFEATGMGSMLLTEHQPNIESFFEPGREIETFRGPGEMLEKIRWYLDHPRDLESVAEAGRRACHQHFSCRDRAEVLEEILLRHLDDGAAPRPSRAQDAGRLPATSPTAPATTLHGAILSRLAQAGDAPVLHLHGPEGWRDWSGRELSDRIRRWKGFFLGACRKGDLVLFSKRLDIDLVAGYLGAMAAGCIPAQTSPESPRIPPTEHRRRLEHILHATGAGTIVCDVDTPEILASAGRIVRPSDLPPDPSDDTRENPDGICLAQFSSGTTGLQKAVLMSHRAVLAHMDAYAPAIGLGPSDAIASWLPLYHDMGLMAAFLMPLCRGVRLALTDPFSWIARPGLLGEAAERFGGTIAFLPNFSYHVLARTRIPGMEKFRLLVNCSEPARPDTHRLFLEAYPGIRPEALSVCWAMAENSFAVSQTPAGTTPLVREIGGRRLLSCGGILPGTEVVVLDPDPEGVGELAIRGACLFSRFLDGSRPLVDGFYPTGDLGAVVDGEVYVAGRRKDLLIVHGKNIHPQDVEHAANQCPGVHPGRTVCFGVESEASGSEEMVVLFEPVAEADPAAAALAIARAVEAETGIAPRRTLAVPAMSLVKTSSGKTSRSRNKELFLQGTWEDTRC